ncbi:hypothetical protein CSOJ01_09017 [Colletotrichum sojae]|uniref:Uncharacterized protein n=1 Tax=Colletotrichum sojae TaxID=2175907 RepID=A0A8H6MS43_9PEZI|nr:hypothetical protein CSOJ01_09017 [Colletotrichum sojae]
MEIKAWTAKPFNPSNPPNPFGPFPVASTRKEVCTMKLTSQHHRPLDSQLFVRLQIVDMGPESGVPSATPPDGHPQRHNANFAQTF